MIVERVQCRHWRRQEEELVAVVVGRQVDQ